MVVLVERSIISLCPTPPSKKEIGGGGTILLKCEELGNFFPPIFLGFVEFVPQARTLNRWYRVMCGEMFDENEKWNSGDWFLYHDYAPFYSGLPGPDFLPWNKMAVVTCPLYSFDIVLYDFLFFPELRVAFKGR